MSSVSRSLKSIPSATGFFNVIAAFNISSGGSYKAFTDNEIANNITSTYTVENLGSVLNVTSGTASDPTATGGAYALTAALASSAQANTSINVGAATVAVGKILRDLGKTLYVQQNGQNVQIFKLVSYVNNVTGEGAYPTAQTGGVDNLNGFYIPVWSADGSTSRMVSVARTGY
jgi:hypothetical protein